MKYSKHCRQRMQQRGKSPLDILVIKKYGEYHRGGIRLLTRRRAKVAIGRLSRWVRQHKDLSRFSRRCQQARQVINSIERTINWMTINADDLVVTVYPADKTRQRKFTRGKCRQV